MLLLVEDHILSGRVLQSLCCYALQACEAVCPETSQVPGAAVSLNWDWKLLYIHGYRALLTGLYLVVI